MYTYHLELNDVNDFIPELANNIGTGFDNNLGEFSLQVPATLGSGEINCINFPNGIGLYTFHCNFNEDLKLTITHPTVKPIRFIYNVEGNFKSYFLNEDKFKEINDHEYLIAAPKDGDTHSIVFKKDVQQVFCYLEIDRKKFQQYLSFDLNEVEPIYYKIFSDVKASNRISKSGKFSLKTSDIIREIKQCDLEGFPRINFIGAKSLEILSYMLIRFKKESQEFKNSNLRDKDLKAVEKAVKYMEANITNAGTVHELAIHAGVNSNKLQEGFQAVYGKTVNEYLRDIRLTKALKMLSSGKKNVSEVVYELGLSSRSYFSKIFKAKYGISPRCILSDNKRSSIKERIKN